MSDLVHGGDVYGQNLGGAGREDAMKAEVERLRAEREELLRVCIRASALVPFADNRQEVSEILDEAIAKHYRGAT